MMPITFDRSVCCDLNETISREWLITNGQGGYASGTASGVLTRMQHGLLAASLDDLATPQLLLAKIDEEVVFDQRTYYLGTNEYQDGTLNPSGFVHLETFRLEEGFPIFTYRLGGIDGILLEKRVWMPRGLNTTYIQYHVLRNSALDGLPYESGNGIEKNGGPAHSHSYPEAAQRELTLKLLPFSAYRSIHKPQYGNNDWYFRVQAHPKESSSSEDEQLGAFFPQGVAGCTVSAWDGAHPYHILAVGSPESETTFIPTGVWYWHFLRRHERAAGLPPIDDLYLPGVIRTKLSSVEDSTLTIIVTAEDLSTQTFSTGQIDLSYNRSLEHQRSFAQPQRYFGEGGESVQPLHVLPLTTSSHSSIEDGEYLHILLQAADRFFARRTLSQSELSGKQSSLFNLTENIPFLISSYCKMQDSARDTFIALAGLTLVPGRYEEASRILRSFARYFKQGMLPDRLPEPGRPLTEQDYGSVDTTLWYFYAFDHYLQITRDYELLDDLYARFADSISWYMGGTYNSIQVDPSDGLLRAHQPGKALTWMNATVNSVPVTPREGKPVEVNALWYHTLSLMQEWSQILYHKGRIHDNSAFYEEQSLRCRQSFNSRFWYPVGRHLYDVIDGPGGNDTALRPNQLLALSLRHPVLAEEYQSPVYEAVTEHLVTPFGLRTLAAKEVGYQGRLNENQEDEQRALHQGSAWPWLIGPYVDALLHIAAIDPTPNASSNGGNILREEYVWRKGLQILDPFRNLLTRDVLGMVGDVFDGDAPHNAGHEGVSALSIAEILRIYKLLSHMSLTLPVRAITV